MEIIQQQGNVTTVLQSINYCIIVPPLCTIKNWCIRNITGTCNYICIFLYLPIYAFIFNKLTIYI